MKLTSTVLCLVVLCVFGLCATVRAVTCRYGERYGCGSSDCEQTCASEGEEPVCTVPCTNGCYCAKGYVRGPYGTCSPKFVCRYKSISGIFD